MTITEAMVALGIIWFALLGMITTIVISTADVGLSRQRQAATGIANELLEHVRGLSYIELRRGLSSSDGAFAAEVAAGGNIKQCGTSYYFGTCPSASAYPERIVATPGLSQIYPLVPHRDANVRAPDTPTTFTRSVYVTEVYTVQQLLERGFSQQESRERGAPRSGAYRVTVVVSWPPLKQGASGEIESSTLVYAPVGCVDPSTHPFAAPCSPYFYATGIAAPSTIEISGLLDGESFKSRIQGPTVRTGLQMEQLGRAQAAVAAASAAVQALPPDSELAAAAGSSVISSIDDDPATAAVPTYQSESLSAAGASSPTPFDSQSGNRWRATSELLASSTGDAGSVVSAMRAGGSQPCPSSPETPATDALPCTHARVVPGTRQVARLDINSLGSSTDTIRMASIDSSTASSLAKHAAHTGGDGQARLTSSRSIPQVRLLGLPASVQAPTNWHSSNYLIQMSGYSDQATSSSGTGLTSPTAPSQSGSVSYWNGNGYTTITPTATQQTIAVDVSASGTTAQGVVTTTIQGTFSSGGSTVSQSPASGTTRTAHDVVVAAPIFGEFTYRVELAGPEGVTVLADLQIKVDLGSLTSRTSYRSGTNV